MSETNLPEKVETDFRRYARMTDFSGITPKDGIALMVGFSRQVGYKHDQTTPYGDTLLFEYGVYDWGKGENFDLKITRQVVFEFSNPLAADDHIIQISLTFKYPPDPFRHLPAMTKWAADLPTSTSIESFAVSSPGYVKAATMPPRAIELYSSAQ